jgi:predicted transport protein
MKLFTNGKMFSEYRFEKETEFEKEITANSKYFFGKDSILIEAKRKIETKAFGNSIPDGFLFDLSNKDNPEFYILEIELAKHKFFDHIFPQITKFFGFFKNESNQADLVEKIFTVITNDLDLKKEFKKYLGEKEIYKFIKDTIENSQNILLVIDEDKKELPDITETYSDTWGKIVKVMLVKKYTNGNEFIYTIHPDFENIEYAEIVIEKGDDVQASNFTEEYHLEGIADTLKKVYSKIKETLFTFDNSIIFNPQKYYISIKKDKNIAYLTMRKKKIRIVFMASENDVRKQLSKHAVIRLSDGVQKFYSGESCSTIVEDENNLSEVIEVIKNIIRNAAS